MYRKTSTDNASGVYSVDTFYQFVTGVRGEGSWGGGEPQREEQNTKRLLFSRRLATHILLRARCGSNCLLAVGRQVNGLPGGNDFAARSLSRCGNDRVARSNRHQQTAGVDGGDLCVTGLPGGLPG